MNKIWNTFIGKYKKLSVPAKAGLWFTICGFIQKGISFITVPIFTRLLTTSQYGVVSVYNSWLSLVSIFCTLNLFYGGFNNGMLDYEDKRDHYVSAIQGLITTISFGWLVIYLVGRVYWNELFEMDSILVFVMFAEILATAGLSLWSARERYEFRYRNLVLITIANAFFASFLSVLAIWLCSKKYGAEVKIVCHAIVVLIICGNVYLYNFRKGKCFFDREIWKMALLFNLPLLPHYLSTMVLNQADRIMISKMVGESEAGIYSVAYSAAMILNIMVTAINNSFAPWLYGKLKAKNYEGIDKVVNMLFGGVALVLVMLIAFAPECIFVLAGSKYAEAVMIIPAVASSLYFIFMYQIFANVEFYHKKNKFIAYASVSGALLNIVLNYFGILWFGYVAAGYTTLICYAVFGCAHYIFMKKICNEEMGGVKLFDAKTVFLIGIILVAFSIVLSLIYPYTILRYSILAVIIIILFASKSKILQFIKIIKER